MSILVVAEKPSVARDIAKVLGCSNKGDGYLYGGKYTISWAIGHLVALCEPEDYDSSYKKWNMERLPIIPPEIRLKIMPKTKAQFNVLKKLMCGKDVAEIICATDSGREGELIFRYIYIMAGCKKPVKRLWISSMTESAIRMGFESLKDSKEYDNLFYSARCRSEADWLVGINASRAYSVNYAAHLSIGRVQTPALSFLVMRKKEIEEFVPQKYWETSAVFGKNPSYTGIWFDPKTNDTKIPSYEVAADIQLRIRGKTGEITQLETEEIKKPPPLLFDLTELQRECNRKYGLTAKKTLEIAQGLYERHKIITYPRTDSRYLSTDMAEGVKKVLEAFGGELEHLAQVPLSKPLPILRRVYDNLRVTDHHAIIPTGKTPAKLSEAEAKVYDLIARRIIAAFYPDYRYRSTRVVTVSEGENFLSKGIAVIDLGWTSVLGNSSKNDGKESDSTLPPISLGDVNPVVSIKAVEKLTQPPKPYTDASILSAMEHAGRFVEDEELREQLKGAGLGTPATRAQIIERLIDVGYAKRTGKALHATDKAVKLIQIVPNELKSPETTAKWERALSLIAKGEMQSTKFNRSIERYVSFIIEESKKINTSVVFEKEGAPTYKKSYGKRKKKW